MNEITQELMLLSQDPGYRFGINGAGIFHFPPNYRFDPHRHREIEINCIISGSSIMKVDGKTVPLKCGDCILIRPFTEHSFFTELNRTCRITQLVFSVVLPAQIIRHISCLAFHRPFYVLCRSEEISGLIENIGRYRRNGGSDSYTEAQIELSLLQLYLSLSRRIEEQRRSEDAWDGKLGHALELIEQRLEYEINLEDISRSVGVSSRYLRREFQDKLGMTSSAFIRTLRIARAKELLWNTNKTVREIAMLSGFGSAQYFCRIFRQSTQMTPHQYRGLWDPDSHDKEEMHNDKQGKFFLYDQKTGL